MFDVGPSTAAFCSLSDFIEPSWGRGQHGNSDSLDVGHSPVFVHLILRPFFAQQLGFVNDHSQGRTIHIKVMNAQRPTGSLILEFLVVVPPAVMENDLLGTSAIKDRTALFVADPLCSPTSGSRDDEEGLKIGEGGLGER